MLSYFHTVAVKTGPESKTFDTDQVLVDQNSRIRILLKITESMSDMHHICRR
jgi:hypothetical protein